MPKNLGNEIIPVRTSDPSGQDGQIYFNTATNYYRCYDGSAWKTIPALIQSTFDVISVDTTTTSTSTSGVALLTRSITTGANFIIVNFTCCSTNAGTRNYFQLYIDGTRVAGTGVQTTGGPLGGACAITWRQSVTAASHTVQIRWYVSGSTGQIRPVTRPNQEHASLVVMEVAS